ncbi:NYN domain-containing protein [Candidatus Uhrbacteria bacterium]|nr:NYN domain-containing protein [Candidatus Uhrbacteria bacterium]
MTVDEKQNAYYDILRHETALIAYLDITNMFHWQNVLGWRFRIESVIKQLLSFPSVKEVKAYYGVNERDLASSLAFHKRIRLAGATLRSKPMKFIRKNIDQAFLFKRSTMTLFNDGITSKVHELVEEIRKTGLVIEEPKCNFDVEMAMDIMDDAEKVSGVILYSGDSDMAAPLERLKLKGKKVYIVGVRNMTAGELHKVKDRYIDFGRFYDGKRNYL